MKTFKKTKVISKNIITDFVQNIRNMLGLELISYAQGIEEATSELEKEFIIGKQVKWFRFDIEQTNGNAFIITIYGEYK